VLRQNLGRSPLYGGAITGIGPRYCPSIEDKVVKFADKERHQIFLEPEGLDTHEVYLNGMSTSMPVDVQQEMVRRVPGLGKARMIRPGYAIEYDFVDPTELLPSLETKKVGRLLHAGQLNGTTGYEEAAAQGLVAGINAARRAAGAPPVLFSRLESYIGIMVDDLVTRGVDEPYRMFTSRSELRLLLRIDNADRRLTGTGYALGLVPRERHARFVDKYEEVDRVLAFLKTHRWDPLEVACPALGSRLDPVAVKGATLEQILRRPGVGVDDLQPLLERHGLFFAPAVRKAAEIEVRYEGYIAQQKRDRERLGKAGARRIPEDLDFSAIPGLSREIREKLARVKPRDLGMAGRIPGVTPAAVSILNVHLELRRREKEGSAP
jgi:tRNA uridine 5-carboxymethylaminomethyl modification enzyme